MELLEICVEIMRGRASTLDDMNMKTMKNVLSKAGCIRFLLAACLGMTLTGCEPEPVTLDIVGIYPAQGAAVAPGSITFSWLSNGYGDYRFRLGNAEMSTILLDTVLSVNTLTIAPELDRAATYHWEVTQGLARLDRDFIAADLATLRLESPANGAVLPLTGNTFTWKSNSQGPFRFRLIDSTTTQILVDQNIYGASVTPAITLDPNTRYYWDVRVENLTATANFITANVAQINLLAPTSGSIVGPCCDLLFQWQSSLQAPYQFRLTRGPANTLLLDSLISATSYNWHAGMAPGMNHVWQVSKGAQQASWAFRVQALEELFPAPINGTWYTQHVDLLGVVTSNSYPGSITVSNLSQGTYGRVGNGNPIPFSGVTLQAANYMIGDSLNYEKIEVYFGVNQVIYEYRTTIGGVTDRGRFVGQ